MLLRPGIAAYAVLVHAAVLASLMIAPSAHDASAAGPAVDPDVRRQLISGRSRVLVELRVNAGGDAVAIAVAQERVLAALPPGRANVARRYTSLPLLAVDIDAEALRILEGLGDVVVRVRVDPMWRPN